MTIQIEHQRRPLGPMAKLFIVAAAIVVATVLGTKFALEKPLSLMSNKGVRSSCPAAADEELSGVLRDNGLMATTNVSFCFETSRCKHLDIDRRFSFVHISKCAGSSWIQELRKIASNVFPTAPQGTEHSVAYQNSLDPFDHLSHHLISLKSPRHHVWSQFTECKYDDWGKRVTNRTTFPRAAGGAVVGEDKDGGGGGDVEDFEQWLDHFLDNTQQRPAGVDRYFCYHPANKQSQHLATALKATELHGPLSNRIPLPSFEPDYNVVHKTYLSLDWVALVEFFHESKCLLYYRLVPKSTEVVQYLKSSCVCLPTSNDNNNGGGGKVSDIQVQHHDDGHRSELRTLPERILHKVSVLTRIDAELYTEALHMFLREVAWLESGLGRRVLCDSVLERLEPELSYLNVNVTNLYYHYADAG